MGSNQTITKVQWGHKMPNLLYTTGIPASADNPSDDQPNMQVNNDSNASIWNADHFGFNNNKGGRHQQVTLSVEVSPPLVEGDLILYTKNGNGQNVLWAKNATQDQPLFVGTSLGGANGHTSLFGGIVLQYGSILGSPIANGTVITFPTPFLSGVFAITLGGQTNSTADKTINVKSGSVTLTTFTVITSGSSNFDALTWIAIGQ
jgi:hypothetical protein